MRNLSNTIIVGALTASLSFTLFANQTISSESNNPHSGSFKPPVTVAPESRGMISDAQRIGSDTWITTKAKTKLLAQGWTGVSVETNNGVILLTGEVESDMQSNEIQKAVSSLDNVKSVNNQLTIKK